MKALNIYLDNNATTCPLKEVRIAMLETLEYFYGNASSAHSLGRKSKSNITIARESVATLIGSSRNKSFLQVVERRQIIKLYSPLHWSRGSLCISSRLILNIPLY